MYEKRLIRFHNRIVAVTASKRLKKSLTAEGNTWFDKGPSGLE